MTPATLTAQQRHTLDTYARKTDAEIVVKRYSNKQYVVYVAATFDGIHPVAILRTNAHKLAHAVAKAAADMVKAIRTFYASIAAPSVPLLPAPTKRVVTVERDIRHDVTPQPVTTFTHIDTPTFQEQRALRAQSWSGAYRSPFAADMAAARAQLNGGAVRLGGAS